MAYIFSHLTIRKKNF